MKNIIGGFIMAVLAVCLALPNLVFAVAEGDTASGSFKFLLEDGETRYVEFKATGGAEGAGSGEMTLSDPAAIPVDDPDNTEKPNTPGVLVRAKFDSMETSKNTAILEGEIFESNVPSAIGQRILLVVEDNGVEGAKDRLTWCIYQQPKQGWIPTDAERDDDKGASLTWLATDAERKDDVGIQMPQGTLAPCKSLAGAAQEFFEFKYGGGDLVVTSRQ
ncbi:MAG TPA: hypothetical protein VLB46_06850 [Pyrinomonadaceae bacterium]|nr:hypothetical protein [Pyrinomonadaceae bacterium]